MRSLIKPLAMALLVAITISSCSKDEKENDTAKPIVAGTMTVDGVTYNLQTKGFLDNYGLDDGSDPDYEYAGTNLDLLLLTEGIQVLYDSQGDIDSVYGSGLVLSLESFSSSSTKLADGTYTFDGSSPYPVNSFSENGFYTSPDFSELGFIDGGSYTVSTAGSTYTITFDLTDLDGKKITGTFNGTLKVID